MGELAHRRGGRKGGNGGALLFPMSVAVSNQLQNSFFCMDPHNPAMQGQKKRKTSSDHRQRPDSMSSKAQQARLQTLHGNPEIWDLSPDRTAGLHGCFTDAAAASSSCFPVPTDRARHAAATLRAHIPTLPSATQTNTRACGSGPHPQRSTAELSISSKTLFST